MTLAIDLCERGLIPDTVMRFGMRRLLGKRLQNERAESTEQQREQFRARLLDLRDSPVAVEVAKANEQHYEVPAEFFRQVLGRRLKYSSCFWDNADNLDAAEVRMLDLTCERAELKDGQNILELGCGWGSLTLWMAESYPGSTITAVSNSSSQREFILARAREGELTNVEVITADANEFDTDQRFDRIVSVEMFEHMRNYDVLMKRIYGWLKPGGKLFVHIFCHREFMYPFVEYGKYDWMARYFFTGGLMPSESTLLHFQNGLELDEQWRISGDHYQKTCNAWLDKLDANRTEIVRTLSSVYGAHAAQRWVNRWRMFFMACAELFGYRSGTEWMVAHYRFKRAD